MTHFVEGGNVVWGYIKNNFCNPLKYYKKNNGKIQIDKSDIYMKKIFFFAIKWVIMGDNG